MAFAKLKPSMGGDKQRIGDDLAIFSMKEHEKKWVQVRFVGPVRGVATAWLDIVKKNGDKIQIPVTTHNYNSETDSFEDNGCPYEEAGFGPFRKSYYVNVIVRELQEDEPKKKGEPTKRERKKITEDGFEFYPKEKGSKTWTPVEVMRIPSSLMAQLISLKDLNRAKNKKTGEFKNYDIDHPKYGCDVSIFYDSSQSGTGQYRVQKGERTPLTEEELDYHYFSLANVKPLESLEEAKRNAESLLKIVDNSDEEEDEDEPKAKKSKKSSKKGKSKDEDEDDDLEDEEDELEEDLDEDEDEAPKKSKNKKSSKKSKSKVDDDEDEDDDAPWDDDDGEEDEDEDEKPKKKSKEKLKKKDKKKAKKKAKDEDDDDDADEDDTDEDEDW